MGERRGEWSAQKRRTIDALAEEILQNHGRGRTIVAVDGRQGSETAQIASALVESLQAAGSTVFHAAIENFQHPQAHHNGDQYARGYDYSLLRRVLIEPYLMAGSTGFALAGFDADRDEPVSQPKWKSAGADAVLIVDGVFLRSPELADIWDYSIWVEGSVPEDDADVTYWAAVAPATLAAAIVDNSDAHNPQRVVVKRRRLLRAGWFFRFG